MKRKIILSGLLILFCCNVFSAAMNDDTNLAANSENEMSKIVYSGVNDFACTMFKKIDSNKENPTFSPLSIYVAMSMLYAGAQSETQSLMQERMFFGINSLDFHNAISALIHSIARDEENDGQAMVRISNGLYIQKGLKFLDSYTSTLSEKYRADSKILDFKLNPDQASDIINADVAKATNQEIPRVVGNLSPDTATVLTNAIYFQNKWREEFNELFTVPGVFNNKCGSNGQAHFMSQRSYMDYFENDDLQLAKKDYVDSDYSAIFILPKEGMFESVKESLSNEMLLGVLAGLETTYVNFKLPKFEVEFAPNMNEILNNMGLSILFDARNVDLSGINGIVDGDGKLYVSNVAHQAKVKMYESGTTAAAATAIVVSRTTSVVIEPEAKVFHADRPTIYAIMHNPSNTIMFLGVINKI